MQQSFKLKLYFNKVMRQIILLSHDLDIKSLSSWEYIF